MKERKWLRAADPKPMLEFLRGRASDRKLRLFAVACCRAIWDYLDLDEGQRRRAVEVAEQFADGLVSEDEFRDAQSAAYEARPERDEDMYANTGAVWLTADPHGNFAKNIDRVVMVAEHCRAMLDSSNLADLLREIIGNPFRPVTIDPAWRTATVVSLAQAIYDERAFDRLPILADALEDAGCDNADILKHCREPGEHVRGCWCVDLLLGKT